MQQSQAEAKRLISVLQFGRMDNTDKPQVTDPANKPAEVTPADVNGDLFKKVAGVLGREFKDPEDLLKSVDNLHRMVGDQSIAELRTKAAEADNFAKVIGVYAKSEGLSLADARNELLNSVNDMSDVTPAQPTEAAKVSIPEELVKRLERAEAVADKIQERELLELFPESKHVINEVKALAKAAGKELKEFYEASAIKEVA